MPNSRLIFFTVALICAVLLGSGYYLEFVEGLEPCPLCILQRLAFLALLIVAAIAAIHNPGRTGRWIYAGFATVAALTGAAIAGRQIWLQHLPPDQVPQCGPGLDYMLDVFPLLDALKMILTGSGECAEIDWTFLGLSIAQWSLAWFILLLLAFLLAASRPH
ncbi:MAG: disulfide bond formation protein B [Gammaproteobacteria bacterium]